MSGWTCAEVRGHLEWFVGGDLDACSLAAVRSHLRDCQACRSVAGSLHRATCAVRALADAPHPAVDDSMFTAMHAEVMAAVAAEAGRERSWPKRLLPLVAAVVLFGLGWWLVRGSDDGSVFVRPPIMAMTGTEGPAKAVPWAGPRVPLRSLGEESDSDAPADGSFGPGMMGRWHLRTLEAIESMSPTLTDVPAATRAGGR